MTPDRWALVRVGDVASVVGGATPKTGDASNFGDDIPWITPKDLASKPRMYVESGLRGLSTRGFESCSARLLPAGAVLLSSRAPIGLVSIAAQPVTTNQGFRSLVLKPGQVPEFWYYLLLANATTLESHANGTTFREISGSALKQLTFAVPGETEQDAIARVLRSLDDKLNVGRRLIDHAHDLIEAVFSQTFAPALAAVADGATLPEGWKATSLGGLLSTLETGSRPKGGVTGYTSGVPSIGAESVVRLGSFDFSKVRYVPEAYYASMRRGHLADRDVLLYKDGGKPGQFEPHVSMVGDGFPMQRAAINEHVYRLRANAQFGQEALYCWLSSKPIMEAMRRSGTGVAIPGLNSTAAKALPAVSPPSGILAAFRQRVEPMFAAVLAQSRQNKSLSDLRDTLIPALMSGAWSVTSAERAVA